MAKKYSKLSKTKKSVLALLAASAMLCTGFAAACSSNEDTTEEETKFATKATDTQVLKNGDFEFFNYPTAEYIGKGKANYLLTSPDNWTENGDGSNAKSGIINTSAWDKLTADDLKEKLDYNSDLTSTDEEYVDYNGLGSKDLPYKDTYAARLEKSAVADSYNINRLGGYEKYFGIEKIGDDYYIGGASGTKVYKKTVAEGEDEDIDFYLDEDCTKTVREMYIANPGTHYGDFKEEGGKYYYGTQEVKKGDFDSYYIENGDQKDYVSNILMVHAYPSSGGYNGIKRYFTSQTVTLEAGTAAEISVWVKTSDLKFDLGKNQLDDYNRGAFIEVVQTVGGEQTDSFVIKAINTEKTIKNNAGVTAVTENASNGWLNYHIYVNACDFAESTVQLNLGLGYGEDDEKCTGYAFFDDVEITKYRTLSDANCTYSASAAKISDATTFHLTDEDKTFVADSDDRHYTSADGDSYYRQSKNFHYLIDLASATGDSSYTDISLASCVTMGLTTETASKNSQPIVYSASLNDVTVSGATLSALPAGAQLPKKLKQGVDVSSDILGVYDASGISGLTSEYKDKLVENLTSESGKLPDYNGNVLVMLSAHGAPYTSTITNTDFALASGESMILSFWVKTSELKGKPAATVSLVGLTDSGERDKDKVYSVAFETTDKTTDFGDSKNIYNDWVQCFIFVQNEEVKGTATPNTQKFAIEFKYGNTTLADTDHSSYFTDAGWAALANLRMLKTTDKVFDLTSAGDFSIKNTFAAENKEATHNSEFDEASGTSDIKTGIATPSKYNGYNGSSMQNGYYSEGLDGKNTHTQAGLINADYFKNYADWNTIAGAFGNSDSDAVTAWNNTFGNSYQPLIIINNLRIYAENASANENTYKNYYVEAESGYTGAAVTYEGKTYRKVADNETYDEKKDYYSFASNYGFVGETKELAANGYQTVSVKVKASGDAVAYVYLVDGDTREVLGYSTPSVTFRYDDDGNVLSGEYKTEAEHSAAVVYTPRNDGLYDGKDGKVYANLHNLTKFYKSYIYENNEFYKNGEAVSYDKVENGEDYYRTAECKEGDFVDHYLVNSKGEKLYEYADGVYYYLVKNSDGDTVRGVTVENFDAKYARYNGIDEKYAVKVTAQDCQNAEDGWVTVSFFIHTGEDKKSYRLELWSGARDSLGIKEDGTITNGAVAFDYSYVSASDESGYTSPLNTYTEQIKDSYTALLGANVTEDGEHSITYYEDLTKELVEKGTLTQAQVDSALSGLHYTAQYYTYTLYDSEAYSPINLETAEDGQTGYEFKISDETEKLSFLQINDNGMFSIFADYSTVDKTVEKPAIDNETEDNTEEETGDGNIWLYVASIVLVVALLITLVSLLLKDTIKKAKRKKDAKREAKNNYRRRQRYIRKLHLVENEQLPEDEDGATEEGETTAEESAPETEDAPVEQENESADEVEETPEESAPDAEEAPAEENIAPAEDTPVEESAAPAEKTEQSEAQSEEVSGESETPEDKE